MKVATSAEMQEIDRRAQVDYGLSGSNLMQEAGLAITRVIVERFKPASVAIVCGKGNNGGDGFVVAHELTIRGVEAVVLLVDPEAELHGAALEAFKRLDATRVIVLSLDGNHEALARADIVVDAILGTGFSGPLRPEYLAGIQAINAAARPVVSVDVPSGLPEGPVDRAAVVKATVTVTIGLPKIQLLTYPGVELAGHLIVEPINFPSDLLHGDDLRLNVSTPPDFKEWVPVRAGDANKGSFGSVGIVAGSAPYAGAALLVARAALRTGCGLAYIATTAQQNPIYKAALPEAITIIAPSADPNYLDDQSIDAILKGLRPLTTLVIGPGLGTHQERWALIEALLSRTTLPAVIDADAITCAAKDKGCHAAIRGRANSVLTPHPGELARILGTSVTEVQSDRIGHARQAAEQFGMTVLLKGASTLVAEADGQVHIVPGSCPALSKGGTGDVLAGVIGSLMAQGCSTVQAAVLGAYLHLHAGFACAKRHGPHGVLASEVADEVPRIMHNLMR